MRATTEFLLTPSKLLVEPHISAAQHALCTLAREHPLRFDALATFQNAWKRGRRLAHINQILQCVKHQGMKLRAVAKRADVDQTNFSKWESATNGISGPTLRVLKDVVGLPADVPSATEETRWA